MNNLDANIYSGININASIFFDFFGKIFLFKSYILPS